MKTKLNFTIVSFALATQVGCASFSTMQTGEVLKKEKSQITVGGGTYNSKAISTAVNSSVKESDLSLPYLEVSYRRGVYENVDVGAKLTLIGTAVVDGKYQFLDTEKFDASAGLGLGYLSLESGSDNNKSKSTIIDVIVPVVFSVNVSPSFTPYISPKYVLRSISGNTSGSTGIAGVTGGIKIGDKWGLYAEYGVQKAGEFSASQINAALFWQ